MLELDHLTVSGDVTFGKNVSLKVKTGRFNSISQNKQAGLLKEVLFSTVLTQAGPNVLFIQGTVIIIANHGDRIDIPAGAMLENKIVSGNLRILDH